MYLSRTPLIKIAVNVTENDKSKNYVTLTCCVHE